MTGPCCSRRDGRPGAPAEVARHYLDLNFRDDPSGAAAAIAARAQSSGDGSATIEQLEVGDAEGSVVPTLRNGDRCITRARVRFNAEVTDPVFGVVWISEQQQNVWAASNVLSGTDTGTFRAGDVAEIEIAFDVVLAPGRYELSMTVTRPGIWSLICAADWSGALRSRLSMTRRPVGSSTCRSPCTSAGRGPTSAPAPS